MGRVGEGVQSNGVLLHLKLKKRLYVTVFHKSNLHYTRGITPKRVTSGGAHLRGCAPGLHSSERTSQRWQAVGDTVSI